MRDWTTWLFARPSFLGGMARLLDFGDTLTEYNSSLSTEQADAIAIRADWEAVAQDFRVAVARVYGTERRRSERLEKVRMLRERPE